MITLVPALLAAADEIRTNSKENVKKPFIIFSPAYILSAQRCAFTSNFNVQRLNANVKDIAVSFGRKFIFFSNLTFTIKSHFIADFLNAEASEKGRTWEA
jgi:hypothetical protein